MTTANRDGAPTAVPSPGEVDVFLSATEILADFRRGVGTPEQHLQANMGQIRRHDACLHSIVMLDADRALERAREATAALARGEWWGSLHGLTVTVKDVFETAGIRTTSGSTRLRDYVPLRDASVVGRLRSSGAILLGKTNTPEFASDAQTVNDLFGRTLNPWDEDRTPGGSSGGAAVAIASGFSAIEVGSDIGGSLRTPAHFCGVFAFKPTDHLVPWTGHIPPPPGRGGGLLRDLLSIGPIARSVEDLELAMSVLAGPDGIDIEVPEVPFARAERRRLTDLRFAWWTDVGMPIDESTSETFERVDRLLAARGCRVVHDRPAEFDFALASAVRQQIQIGGTSVGSRRPPALRAALRTLGDVWPAATPALRGFLRGAGADLAHYAKALADRARLIRALEKFLRDVDAFLMPVAPGPAFRHVDTRTVWRRARATIPVAGTQVPYSLATCALTDPFNTTGSPVVVVPAGVTREGLPIGIQVIGRRWHDAELLAVARTLADEITGPFRRAPRFATSVDPP